MRYVSDKVTLARVMTIEIRRSLGRAPKARPSYCRGLFGRIFRLWWKPQMLGVRIGGPFSETPAVSSAAKHSQAYKRSGAEAVT